MARGVALGLALLLASPRARADDGVFYEQSIGVAIAGGDARRVLGIQPRFRAGVGLRIGALVFEPFIAANAAFERDHTVLYLFGGTPSAGHADLATIGFDLKYVQPLSHATSLYVRAGPRFARGDGELAGYRGYGFGGGGGVQIVGRVRALGFLFAPLFFLPRGPRATGGAFLEIGDDALLLRAPHRAPLDVPVAYLTFGFAVGTAF